MTSNDEALRAPRWYQRALPVSALLVALVAVLALVFPAFRHQVALSATHQTQEYVALSFGRATDGTVLVCDGAHASVKVKFAVDSHLDESRKLKYVVTVGTTRRTGTVSTDAGRITTVSRSLPHQAGPFDVTVNLPQLGQHVVSHCSGGRS